MIFLVGDVFLVGGQSNMEFPISFLQEHWKQVCAILKLVHSSKVARPFAVRYAWSNNPVNAELYNRNGFPANPFRTDSWLK